MRPHRNHAGKTHAVVYRPVQHRCRQRTRLAHHPERALARQRPHRARIEIEQWPLQADRIGTKQIQALAPRDLAPLLRLLRIQAAGKHQRAAAARAPRQCQGSRHIGIGQRDHRQIGARLHQVGQRAAGVHIQIVQRAAISLRLQRLVQGARLSGELLRRIAVARKDEHRIRREQRREVVLFHHGGKRAVRAPACRQDGACSANTKALICAGSGKPEGAKFYCPLPGSAPAPGAAACSCAPPGAASACGSGPRVSLRLSFSSFFFFFSSSRWRFSNE